MKKLTIANLKKTIYYLKRNGLRSTLNAAKERLAETESYAPKAFSEEELTAMRKESEEMIREAEGKGVTAPFFHILVPAYRTDPKFLKELVESVQAQVYPRWELLILDASEDEGVLQALLNVCAETKRISQALLNICAETKRISRAQDGEEAVAGGTVDEGDLNYEQLNYEQLIGKVRYLRLASNAGISENTNAGLPYVSGGYVGLLDHDDVLTPDAL